MIDPSRTRKNAIESWRVSDELNQARSFHHRHHGERARSKLIFTEIFNIESCERGEFYTGGWMACSKEISRESRSEFSPWNPV